MRIRLLVALLVCVIASWAQRGGGAGGGQAQGQPGGNQAGATGAAGQQRSNTSLQVTDPKLLCTLEGQVFDASTGAPIPRASLTLMGSGGRGGQAAGMGGGGGGARSARTDSEGKFTIDKVQAGTYRLTAERVGFLRQQYGSQTPGGTGAPINLSPSQNVRNLNIKMTPQGVILGTVLDDSGDPLPGAMVAANRAGRTISMSGGRGGRGGQQSGGSGTAVTNDIGVYRIAGLTPGSYLVVATAQAGRGGAGGRGGMAGRGQVSGQAAASATAEEDILPTYYPSTTDPAGAVPMQVAPGQELAGINILLRKGSLYRVQGRVAGGTAQDLAAVQLNLVPRGGINPMLMGRGLASRTRADGTFEITSVQPGSYYLIAESMIRGGGGGRGGQAVGGPGAGAAGRTLVDVTAGDLKGVLVTLADPLTVTGTLKVEGQQGAESQAISLALTQAEPIMGMPGGTASARVSQGAFKITGVTPDIYYLNVSGLPEGSYLKSVRVGNQEVIDKGIDLTAASGTANFDVTLSTKGGSVEGTVSAGGDAAPGSYIMLLADPLKPGQPYLNRSSTSDQDGKFTIKGLAPGDYKLYAFAEAQPEIAADLELIKPFESNAVKISISESGTEQAELKVLKPEDARQ